MSGAAVSEWNCMKEFCRAFVFTAKNESFRVRRKTVKGRKKWLRLGLLLALLCSLWQPLALAATEQQQKEANFLNALGLLQGTGAGYELDRGLSRGEAAVLLTRFLGGEAEALRQNGRSPFSDVPDWCAPHVAWLYEKGLTKGVGGSLYGTERETSIWQYALFLNRANSGGRYDRDYVNPYDIVLNTIPQEKRRDLTLPVSRGEAVSMSVAKLSRGAGGFWDKHLAVSLIEQGVITEAAFKEHGASLFNEGTLDVVYLGKESTRIGSKSVAGSYGGYVEYVQYGDVLYAWNSHGSEYGLTMEPIDTAEVSGEQNWWLIGDNGERSGAWFYKLNRDGETCTLLLYENGASKVFAMDALVKNSVIDEGSLWNVSGKVYFWTQDTAYLWLEDWIYKIEMETGKAAMWNKIPADPWYQTADQLYQTEAGICASVARQGVYFLSDAGIMELYRGDCEKTGIVPVTLRYDGKALTFDNVLYYSPEKTVWYTETYTYVCENGKLRCISYANDSPDYFGAINPADKQKEEQARLEQLGLS